MPSPTFIRIVSTVAALGAALLGAGTAAAAAGAAAAASPAAADSAKPAPLVIRPEKGFIDDAYALTQDGSALVYVNTDGANWATLRAVGLPSRADAAASPATAPPATAPPAAAPPAAPPGKGRAAAPAAAPPGNGKAAPAAAPPGNGKAAAPAAAPFTIAPGTSQELVANLPLSTFKMYLLPDDRVLVVSRDTEIGGVVNGTLYSLRSRSAVPLALGPATDITIAHTASGPAIVAITRPTEQKHEYRVQAVSSSTLKPLAQKIYKLREGEPRVQTERGSAMPLYFLDDYLTLVAKHDGFYDKKKDARQPDFLAFLDAPSGKLTRSRPIAQPAALLELARLRTGHGESVIVTHDPETQRFELLAALDRGLPDGPAESRTPLGLPRPASAYEPATLLYQLVRPGLLVLSLTVDPVNEQAVAARRTDPDLIDLCAVELGGGPPGPAQRLRTLPGNKRPSSWKLTPNGRLALLRKHKGFARGGTEIEIYDLDLPPAVAKTALP